MSGGAPGPGSRGRPGGGGQLLAPERLDRPFSDPLVQRIFPPLATGVHWGLERTRDALSDIGDPQQAFPVVHVGGTNGKGSVAATVASVLEAHGLRAGLYTSPHLLHFRERFQVGGRPLGDATLARAADGIRDTIVHRGLTFFEAATVLGMRVFADAGVEVAVVEVGLGGRLDATNVLTPVCSVITNVAMDHADFLGSTLPSIAREKAGIIKPGVPVLTAEADPGLLELFREVARRVGAPFTSLDPVSDLHHVEVAPDRTSFRLETRSWGTLALTTPLVGRHQALNAALAVEALEHLPGDLRPDARAVEVGVRGVHWPGRDQVEVTPEGTWVLDVAHNTAGILSLVDVLDRLRLPRPLVALVGVLGDKDWRAMLPPLLRRCDRAVLTQPPSAPVERRWKPWEALREVSAAEGAPVPVAIEEDFDLALARAREEAGTGTVVVTGSVHTVGSALSAMGREPFPMEGPPGCPGDPPGGGLVAPGTGPQGGSTGGGGPSGVG